MSPLGFVSLHRDLLDKPVFRNEKLLKVWIWCLLKASYKPHDLMVGLQKIALDPGQFVTGREAGSRELKLNPSTFWKYLKWLEVNQSLNIKSNNKFSVITVVNWALYQFDNKKNDNKFDSKKTATKQQNDTNNKDNNDNKNNIVRIVDFYHERCSSLPPVLQLTAKRKSAINSILKEFQGENFENVFDKVGKSDFLSGRSGKWTGCSFDWIIKLDSFVKILEGHYDNKIANSERERELPLL